MTIHQGFPSLTVLKDLYTPFQYNSDKPNRLAIVDPNKADNNVSGGTAEIDLVFKCFSQAHNDLQARMAEQEGSGLTPKSLLSDLLGGDYQAYGLQRERLRRIYSKRHGQNKLPLPPLVSLAGPPGAALPNVAVAGKKTSNSGVTGPSYQTNGRKDSTGKVRPLPHGATRS